MAKVGHLKIGVILQSPISQPLWLKGEDIVDGLELLKRVPSAAVVS